MRVLPRGNFLDESGEIVTPAVPRFLPPLDTAGRRATRLDLARWLTSRENPLTARVLVNRLWRLYFGQGLSRTLEDLGSQGEWPTHPELLDWLAVELMDSGWDVKRMVKTLVTSAAYQQSSVASPALVERGSLQPPLRAPDALPPRRGDGARQRARGERPAVPEDGRPERPPLPAPGLLGLPELPAAGVGRFPGRRPVPPRPLHLVAAGLPPARASWPSTPRAARSAWPTACAPTCPSRPSPC